MRHVGEYSPAETGEYPRIFPNFQNCVCWVKDLKDNKDNSLHLERKYARIFVLGHYLFLVAHSLRSRKTVRYSEQIMSADKYPSIFSRQMEAIVYIDTLLIEPLLQASAGNMIACVAGGISRASALVLVERLWTQVAKP